MSSIWAKLSEEEKDDLLNRKHNGESPIDLAKELDMYPPTLDRRLREWAQLTSQPRQEPSVEEPWLDRGVFEDNPDRNHRVVYSKDERITTLDGLLKACGVDLAEWDVEKHVVNKWEGYRKSERRSFRWGGGSIQDGYLEDDGTLHIEPLFQVKAWLVRKKPIPIEPVVRPVSISFSAPKLTPAAADPRLGKALVLPDVHLGFSRDAVTGRLHPIHDRRALDVVCKIMQLDAFDKVVILGDFFDLADWSDKFIRSPDFEQVTQPAIEEGAWWLARFVSLQPAAEFYYIEGNHEKRIRDAIVSHLPQAYHLKPAGKEISWASWELPYLLGLEELGITWVGGYPNGRVWISDDTCAIHGDGLNAKRVIDTHDVNVVFGHIHKADIASRTLHFKDGMAVITAMSPGFLGRIDGTVPGAKLTQDWSQGVVVVYTADGMEDVLLLVPLTGDPPSAVFNGVVLRGEDQVGLIREGVRWNI